LLRTSPAPRPGPASRQAPHRPQSISPHGTLSGADTYDRQNQSSCYHRIKNPGFSALLSSVFFGLGQAYNGQFLRGVLILVGTLFGGLSFAPAGAAIWLFGICDAYATARRMNGGTVPYRDNSIAAVILFFAVWLAGLLLLPATPAAVSTLTSELPSW